MLSAFDLQFMIATENQAMSSTATIYRPTTSAGALGNTIEQWVNVGTCSCDIWPINKNNRERSSGNQELALGEFFISVPYNTDVQVIDVLEIDNKTYEVTFVPLGQSWLTNLRLEARNYNNQSLFTNYIEPNFLALENNIILG